MSDSQSDDTKRLTPEQIAERQARESQTPPQGQPQAPKKVSVDTNEVNKQKIKQKDAQVVAEQKRVELEKRQGNPEKDTSNKDKRGELNISRGIMGVATNPQKGYTTPGTVADNVNQPSKFPNKEGKVNPITKEDIENRIKNERLKAGMDKERQKQIMVKQRTEDQGFEYTPPEKFKNDPDLQPTKKQFQKKEPVANKKQGEQIISEQEKPASIQLNTMWSTPETSDTVQMTNEQTPTEPQPENKPAPQDNQQENLKG